MGSPKLHEKGIKTEMAGASILVVVSPGLRDTSNRLPCWESKEKTAALVRSSLKEVPGLSCLLVVIPPRMLRLLRKCAKM